MTTLISAHELHLDTGHGSLFHDLSFTVRLGDRIGLVGHNGSGKTSLLGLLNATIEPQKGEIQRAGLCRLEQVGQYLPTPLYALSVRAALHEALDGAPEQAWRVDLLLDQLGLAHAAEQALGELSGGQHSRILLGRAVLRQPNLLLLDEPSNHLDLPSLLWLEHFLSNWQGGLILVSHDVRLLDQVTTKSWILRDGGLQHFDLPCSLAQAALLEADRAAAARHASEQREIERIQASSKRLLIWGREHDNEKLVRKAKSMEKRIVKLQDEQTCLSQGSPWRLFLQGQPMSADRLMSFDGLKVAAAAHLPTLFEASGLLLRPGDKVALLGANGSGKSSLLRQCWQDVVGGEARPGWRYHPSASIAYYDQAQQRLDGQASILDALYQLTQLPERNLCQALISAGFAYARHGQLCNSLSGGERARLMFLALSLARHHLLWLDEPSNHLDLAGKAELAEAVAEFAGGVLLVSHDRALIEQCCNRFWLLQDGCLREWQDAESAYAALYCARGQLIPATLQISNDDLGDTSTEAMDEETAWQRWCALGSLLDADLVRKPKYQKPLQQKAWQAEMQRLEEIMQRAGAEND